MAAFPPVVVPPPGQTPPFVAPGTANPQQKVQNARRDQRRKDGAAVLRAVKNVAGQQTPAATTPQTTPVVPPPPPNSTAEAVPQHAALPAPPQMGSPTTPVPQYTAPQYHQPEYTPPKKGLEYLALGLAVLFPGSPISKMAAGFAGGLQQGAEQAYERKKDAAQADYQNQVATAQADFQNRLAAYNAEKDQIATKFANDQVGYNAALKGLDVKYGDDVARYNAAQDLRKRGIDPVTQKPFVLPKPLATSPDPKTGYDGLARWHEARAGFYEQLGASDLAAQEKAAAADAVKQANDAANNARALAVAQAQLQQRWAIHVDTENHADQRHFDSEYRADRRALLADSTKRAEYSVRALDANRAFLIDYRKLTTGPTKTVKDPQTGQERQVPVLGPDGKPVPAMFADPGQQKLLANSINAIRGNSDPEGAAAYYSHGFDDTPAGNAARQLLDEAAKAAIYQRMSEGSGVQAHAWPKYEVPKPKLDQGKVNDAISKLGSVSAAQIPTFVDEAVKAGKYTQAEGDAIKKHFATAKPAAAPLPIVPGVTGTFGTS